MKKVVKKTAKRRTVAAKKSRFEVAGKSDPMTRWFSDALRQRRKASPAQIARADRELALIEKAVNENRLSLPVKDIRGN